MPGLRPEAGFSTGCNLAMAEISSPRPLPATPPPSRPAQAAADLAVKLLKPLEGMLAAGESAKAEVVAVKESAQSFQLLLKLTLENGRQTTLEASSPRPFTPGATLAVTALSETRLSLTLQAGLSKALTSLDLQQLPVGTVLQGKVESSEQLAQNKAQQVIYKVLVGLLNTPLAGSKLSVETPLPLPVGSLLTAQVQGSQTLNFLPLSSRLDQLVLGQQLASQQARQGSMEGLFKALQSLGDDAPEGVRGSIDKLLGLLPSADQLSTSKGLAQAIANSGAFLEGKLLSGQGSATQDLKANLLRLVAQMIPNLPSSSPLQTANASSLLAQALPALLRDALGRVGQANLRQQALSFPLPSRLLQSMDESPDLEMLLKLAASAIARLQTHQLSSLAQTETTATGSQLTTWQLEVPMRNQNDIVPLQIKLQREEENSGGEKKDQQEILWRLDLAFDLEPLGPLQVQAQLLRGSFSSQLWAQQGRTAELIEQELGNLRERLINAGFEVGELACRQGLPPQGTRTHLEQRWVDETA